ncbi:hypothetical protein [Streptomyces sp. TS71-3]|uniref:hypothetical protein n=1 Tax=Streptomyces sp. TS71-3 TaxID=2733862 RepID=UPI001B2BD3A7|nr:hypothetical protein [Streptomyces sp. TS71-3]GHJ39517.1 hypothetical protein Sm713_51260 [Streptomyces sp. TS71-3]
MPFDAIFDQPDITADPDDLTFELTTYPATAVHTGSAWNVSVHDLPGKHSLQAQAGTWLEAEDEIQELVAKYLEADRTSIVVSVEPADPEARAALRALTSARITRAKAEQAERDAARHASRLLLGQGWTTGDVGAVLRLPEARVVQLTVPAPGKAT